MNSDLEQFLRDTMNADASGAPPVNSLASAARRRWRRRRRASFAVAASAVVGSALGLGVAMNMSGSTPNDVALSPNVTHALPDSGWPESGIAAQALQRGVLAATPDGCFYLERPADVGPLGLLWPQGWTWSEQSDGSLAILDDKGNHVFIPGDHIEVVGGYSPAPSGERDICGVASGAWFPINAIPTKVPDGE